MVIQTGKPRRKTVNKKMVHIHLRFIIGVGGKYFCNALYDCAVCFTLEIYSPGLRNCGRDGYQFYYFKVNNIQEEKK
jgi:hypothetical protein